MAVPSTVLDLSSLTASCSPLGSDPVGNPGTVDDFFRSHAAILRDETLHKSWERRGDTPTRVSDSVFTVPADRTEHYAAGRRFRALGTATVYGTIQSVSYNGTVSTVTIVGDAGATLDTSLSEVQLGIDPRADPLELFVTSNYLQKTGGTLSGTLQMQAASIVGVRTITLQEEVNLGNTGNAKTISWSGGQNARVTVNADTVLTVKTPPGVGHYQLRAIQDATGGRTISFVNVGSGHWMNSASQPAINQNASGETIFTFYWFGSGWRAALQKVGAA